MYGYRKMSPITMTSNRKNMAAFEELGPHLSIDTEREAYLDYGITPDDIKKQKMTVLALLDDRMVDNALKLTQELIGKDNEDKEGYEGGI